MTLKKVSLLLVILFFSCCVYGIFSFKKMPTKQIKIEDIKGIYVLNINEKRRIAYEKKLKNKFGEYFLGHKIEDLRLKNPCNYAKDLTAENVINGQKVVYSDIKNNKITKDIFKEGIWKVCTKQNKNDCLFSNCYNDYYRRNFFTIRACVFSHLRAIEEISKQPDNTYGIVFEDDFDISNNFNEDIKKALNNVPEDFDVLKLTLEYGDLKKGKKKMPFFKKRIFKYKFNSYRKNGFGNWLDFSVQKYGYEDGYLTYGTHAYLVTPKGAKKILHYVKNNFLYNRNISPDILLFYHLPRNIIKSYQYLGEVPFILNMEISNVSLVGR